MIESGRRQNFSREPGNKRSGGSWKGGREGGRVEGWKRKRKRPQEGTKTLDQFVSPLPIVQSGIDSPALGGALVSGKLQGESNRGRRQTSGRVESLSQTLSKLKSYSILLACILTHYSDSQFSACCVCERKDVLFV